MSIKSINSEYELVKRSDLELLTENQIIKRNLFHCFNKAREEDQGSPNFNLLSDPFSLNNSLLPKDHEEKLLLNESNIKDFSPVDSNRVNATHCEANNSKQQFKKTNNSRIPLVPVKFTQVNENQSNLIAKVHNSKSQTSLIKPHQTIRNPSPLQEPNNCNSKSPAAQHLDPRFNKQFRSLSSATGQSQLGNISRSKHSIQTPSIVSKPNNVQPCKTNYESKSSLEVDKISSGECRSEEEQESESSSVMSAQKSASAVDHIPPFDLKMKRHSKDDIALFESFHASKQKKFNTINPSDFQTSFHIADNRKRANIEGLKNKQLSITAIDGFNDHIQTNNQNKKKLINQCQAAVTTTNRNLNPVSNLTSKISKIASFVSRRSPLAGIVKNKSKEALFSQSSSLITPTFGHKDGKSSAKILSSALFSEKSKGMIMCNFKKPNPKKSKKEFKSELLEIDISRSDPDQPKNFNKLKKDSFLAPKLPFKETK